MCTRGFALHLSAIHAAVKNIFCRSLLLGSIVPANVSTRYPSRGHKPRSVVASSLSNFGELLDVTAEVSLFFYESLSILGGIVRCGTPLTVSVWRCTSLVRQALPLCHRGDEAVAVGLVAEALPDSPVDGHLGEGSGNGGGGGVVSGDGVGGGSSGRGGEDAVASILRKVSFDKRDRLTGFTQTLTYTSDLWRKKHAFSCFLLLWCCSTALLHCCTNGGR